MDMGWWWWIADRKHIYVLYVPTYILYVYNRKEIKNEYEARKRTLKISILYPL